MTLLPVTLAEDMWLWPDGTLERATHQYPGLYRERPRVLRAGSRVTLFVGRPPQPCRCKWRRLGPGNLYIEHDCGISPSAPTVLPTEEQLRELGEGR